MLRIGITGSIGMGKSETAALFGEWGIPVYDADAAVHALYQKGGAAVEPLGEVFPDAVREGAVDRAALSRIALGDKEKMRLLEKIVHPLLKAARARFIAEAERKEVRAILFDIPLLFETGGESGLDVVIVASAPLEIQKARVLERAGMTEEKFSALLARQMSDMEKRKKADYIVRTDKGIPDARAQVKTILRKLNLLQENEKTERTQKKENDA